MTRETLAENILNRFETSVLTPLKRDVADPGRSRPAVFILLSVALDNLASIRYLAEIPDRERGCVGKRYRRFIETYLPSAYKPHADLLYKGFRCGLVHEFQLKGIEILDDDAREKHLKNREGGAIGLHAEEFLAGLLAAFEKLKADLTGPNAQPDVVAAFEKSGYKKWR